MGALFPEPHELVSRDDAPNSIAGWQELADSFLTEQSCVFHRNVEISSRYAWMYKSLPMCFKWAGMAALASHHVRLALYPYRLDADHSGRADFERGMRRRRRVLLMADVNTIRDTNNAIFNDIFWAHLAYVSTDDGIERLRTLLHDDPHYVPILAGFEAIDEGRRVLEDPSASTEAQREAKEHIWRGNVQLLQHEQLAVVQPCFDRLSCAFARILSMGSVTSFEVRGVRREVPYFTSFYVSSFKRAAPHVQRRAWPRMTHFDDRWYWIEKSVVPRFMRFDMDGSLVDMSLRRIFEDATVYASKPCLVAQ